MKRLTAFFIDNLVLVYLGIFFVIIFGVISAYNLTSSFFPERETQFIYVEAVFPGASPLEIEEGITLKIEDELRGIIGVDRITSTSSENNAVIEVELLPRANENEVLQEVQNAVDRIPAFPPQMERVTVYKQEMLNFTARFALSGEISLQALKEAAREVEDDLRDFEEISKIQLSGFTEEEIEIEVEENKLRAFNLTFVEIAEAIGANNINITGGIVRGEREEVIIRADNKDYFGRGLEDIVIRSLPDGELVRLSDVATIKDTWSEDTDRAVFNKEPAVIVTVNTTNEENILEAAAFIRDYIEDFNRRNEVIQATMIRDYTNSLRDRISLLEEKGIFGALLVLLVLTAFLRFRLAFWVAMSIPVSFLGMMILGSFYGLTINIMSLFGMILVLGILVDDGVVVGENIFQKHEEGVSRRRAAINGTWEVFPSVFSAVSTTIVAFGLFFFITGILGEFFSDISFVVIASLVVSLLEVVTFLPALLAHSKSMKQDYRSWKWKEKISDSLLRFRDNHYSPLLRFAIVNKVFYLFVVLAIFVLTFATIGGGMINITFFPELEQDEINVSLEMAAGTPDSITLKRIEKVQEAGFRLNEKYREEEGIDYDIVKNVELTLGPAKTAARANLLLISPEEREISSFMISSDLRMMVGGISGAKDVSFTTESPFGKPVSVSLSSSDFEELRQAKEALIAELRERETLEDIVDTDREDQPELNVTINETGKLLGLDLSNVAQQVRNGFFGLEAQRLQRGEDEVIVWVRYRELDRSTMEAVKDMRIRAPNGGSYPLQEVANLEFRKGLIEINHRDGRREITIEAEMASLEDSAPKEIERIRNEVMPEIQAKFPGVDYVFEGQVRETRKLRESLQQAGPVVLLVMLGIIIFTFRSFSQGLMLLLTIPFGLIGAIWGHFIHGLPLSILSVMGFIALIGVLLNDGLVLVNTFNQELGKGRSYREALMNTGRDRFRPIVLTTITTSVGLAPLMFEGSLQAQFLIPMAVTVAYGLIVGSFLLLTLLPVLLVFSNSFKVRAVQLWTGEKKEREWMERSYRKGYKKRENPEDEDD